MARAYLLVLSLSRFWLCPHNIKGDLKGIRADEAIVYEICHVVDGQPTVPAVQEVVVYRVVCVANLISCNPEQLLQPMQQQVQPLRQTWEER